MSRNEIIHEIDHILDRFSDQALQDLLLFLKNLEDARQSVEKDKSE